MKDYWVYIITNKHNTTLYIGVTNNLERRIWEHKNKEIKGFSFKYNLEKLVFFEKYKDINQAILREKQLKNWHKDWKINIIKKDNPKFEDLSEKWEIFQGDSETSSE